MREPKICQNGSEFSNRALKDLAGIQNSVWIEISFDLSHQVEFDITFDLT